MNKKGLTRLGITLLISLILVSAIFGIMFVLANSPPPETDCNNQVDDDSDGFFDCADSDCANDAACQNLYPRACGTGTDLCTWNKALPLGSTDCCNCNLNYNTPWPMNTQNTATCTFDGTNLQNTILYVSINNDVIQCTLNGNIVFQNYQHEGCAPADPRNGYTIGLTPQAGTNTLVCDVNDDVEDPGPNNMAHFDACVLGDYVECDSNDDCNYLDGACADGVCNQQNKCEQQFKSSTEICRASQGVCDIAETCTGSSAECPTDAKSTAECRASNGVCDPAENCDGTNNDCPVDAKAPFSTQCDDGLWCSATDHCDGNGNCVQLTARDCSDSLFCTVNERCDEGQDTCLSDPKDCSGNNLLEIAQCDYSPDDRLQTFDYAAAFTSICDENNDVCTTGSQTLSHTCADADANDNGPKIPPENGIRTCSAECDGFGTECLPYIGQDDYCYINGRCDTDPTQCKCSYTQDGYCPTPGTVYEGNCYWGTRACVQPASPGGCTLMVTPMGCKDTCDPLLGPIDTQGPTTSQTTVDPYYNNGIFNADANVSDICSNIKKSEYFLGHGFGFCGIQGTGLAMDATDGTFDEKVEEIKKDNLFLFWDGLNYICIQSQDVANNWGNCDCAYFETDVLPPDCPYDIYIDKEIYPNEFLICGNDAILNATVCDQQSKIQGGEYFLNKQIPPIPAPWSGNWMSPLYNFTRGDSWKCAILSALLNTSGLNDGTHYVRIRGKDTAENWGKISECTVVSFVRDTTKPKTFKDLIYAEKQMHACEPGEIPSLPDGVTLTDPCEFVKQGTTIDLHAHDFNPNRTDVDNGYNDLDGQYADNVVIHYIVWYKLNAGDAWTQDQQGISLPGQPIQITLSKDSYHLIEYWSVDACGYEEAHHFELDIVDTQKPVTTKTLDGVRIPHVGPEFHYWITQDTKILLSCTDPQPHPVDHEVIKYRYTVDGQPHAGYPDWTIYTEPIQYDEDSVHTLEYYCVDALGNTEVTQVEIDKVDSTPPVTTKEYGQPLVEAVTGGYPKWITSQTPVTLIPEDVGQVAECIVGVNITYWRNTLVPEIFCQNDYDCQQAQGSGEWNVYKGPFTKPEESCHLIEYYSVDHLGNREQIKKQCVYVENTPPYIEKTIGEPKHSCTKQEWTDRGSPDYGCWYITSNTKITLNCYDIMPHPVDHVTLYWRNYLIGETPPAYNIDSDGYAEIYKTPDSEHVLEFYCEDALGNSQGTAEAPHREIDIVDNKPPISAKDLGIPKHACELAEQNANYDPRYNPAPTDGCYFITQQTPVTITCTDDQPHPVDHVKIYYRTYLSGSDPGAFTEDSNSVTFYYPQDSAHVLEWYCVDELGNTETTHVEYDIVDTQAPRGIKEVGEPKIPCDPQDPSGCVYWVRDHVTPITLDCIDGQPHPVDHEEVCYKISFDSPTTPYLTEQYCKQFGGTYDERIGECCADVSGPAVYPFTFEEDSLHDLEYYCIDALGNKNEADVEYFKVDSVPPTTTKTYLGPFYQDAEGYHYIDTASTVELTAKDGGEICAVGVDVIQYRVSGALADKFCYECENWMKSLRPDMGRWYTYEKPFPIAEESCHVIEYRSIDKLGNTEDINWQCVFVDKTPPTITKTYGLPYVTHDGKEWITSSTPITLTVDDVGPHKSGIKETKYRVTLLGSNDACENDEICQQQPGEPRSWTDYTNPFTIEQDSCHLIEYYTKDNVDKSDGIHKQCVYVDNKKPLITKVEGEPKLPCDPQDPSGCVYWVRDHVTPIDLYCTDDQPHPVDHVNLWYRILLDGNEIQPWTDGIAYEAHKQIIFNEDSVHTLQYYCEDELRNSEGTRENPHQQVYRVDSTPPESTKEIGDPKWWDESLGLWWVTSDTQFTLTAIDHEDPCAVGVEKFHITIEWDSDCDGTIDTTLFDQDIQSPYQYTFTLNEECLHRITWYAIDRLGNAEEPHVQYHKVDNTPPHVLILKPVDGWYSDGEDIPIVAVAKDLDNPRSPCEGDCGGLGEECAVGIEDGAQCTAYLLDVLPRPRIDVLHTEGTFLYNAEAKECQGYATIPEETGIPDGVVILVVRAEDNLGNGAGSLAEILRSVFERCGCDVYDLCAPQCVNDVMQDIITIWNLPKIGIDNQAPIVDINVPEEGTLFGGEQVEFSAAVTDTNDGDVTSTITSGAPCYVSLGGISLGAVPYSNDDRKCEGTIMIPQDEDFPQGTQSLKVEIADNAGNIGSGTINVEVDTVAPEFDIIIPPQNQFVNNTQLIQVMVTDENLDTSSVQISTDTGQTWNDASSCGTDLYCYDWDTTEETDGIPYGIIAKARDDADNGGSSEVVMVIVDNGNPEGVYIMNPIKNDIVQGTITLKALAADYVSGIESVSIYVENVEVDFDCVASLEDGVWQCEFDSTDLDDGQHQAYAVATDNLGHQTTSASVPFIIDNNAPSIPVVSVIDPDGDGYDTDGTITWEWSDSYDAGSGIEYYIISISSPGLINTKVYGTTFTVSDLWDGEWHARVWAVDKAGRESDVSDEVTIIVDKTAPSPVIIWGELIENPPYNNDSGYQIHWSGGDDTNFGRYELYRDGGLIIPTNPSEKLTIELGMPQGNHRYQVVAYDEAGHSTASSFFDVFVDTIAPEITENSQSSWPFVGWWFDYSIDDGDTSSGLLTPTYSGGLHLCSWNPDAKTGTCLVIGSANSLTVYVNDKAGHSASLQVNKGVNTDFTAPMILTTSPSGLINYNEVTLTATTNEYAKCYYGTIDDDIEEMSQMNNSEGEIGYGTQHSAGLGTLQDGLYVYHIRCEDMAGNMMEHSKTVVFAVNTESQFCYSTELNQGWNTFFLPQLILDDINFNCGEKPYETGNVLSTLGSNYDVVWYYDGTYWRFYSPYTSINTLTEFNDAISNPYFIKMTGEDRIELLCVPEEECYD